MINVFIVLLGKLLADFIELFKFGSGSTWPGHIALSLNNKFISEVLNKEKTKIILVSGTNGKTTTATMLRHILEGQEKKVFQNEEGANLPNGIASALIKNISFSGKLNYDFVIFEVDENAFPVILKDIKPSAVILLNLFRDQLDRYGEVNTIARKWQTALNNLSKETAVVLDGDDPLIAYLGENLKSNTYFFGIDKSMMKMRKIPHDVDSVYCLRCNKKLEYLHIAYSHLGDYLCKNCGFKKPKTDSFINDRLNYPLKGLYNIYNTNAAFLVLTKVFNLNLNKVKKSLKTFKPAFGRQETIKYQGKMIHLLLSKNPAGFNQSIDVAENIAGNNKSNLLVVLNDRIPDGRDISWIWDVEFEKFKNFKGEIFVAGDRVYDMALRLKYADITNVFAFEHLSTAIEKTLEKPGAAIFLTTYTGMLDIRKILTGKKLL